MRSRPLTVRADRGLGLLVGVLALTIPVGAGASALGFSTDETGNYLLIGMGPVNDVDMAVGVGQASNTNNFELGAIKAPVPSTDSFLDGGSSGGPNLDGTVPDLPSGIEPVPQGIGNGNIAITHPQGVFNLQDVGHYGDRGIDCAAATAAGCDDGTSNSFHNDPNQFPNTFDIGTQTGTTVHADDPGGGGLFADPTTRVDDPTLFGVNANTDFSILLSDIDDAKASVPLLLSTSVLDVTTSGGTIKPDTFGDVSISGGPTLTVPGGDPDTLVLDLLTTGLHVIDIDTGGSDFLLQDMNLVIDGPEGSFALFRLPATLGVTDQNMLISQASIFAGDGGIGLNGIMFFSNRPDNGQHFNFSNTIVNGVVFWTIAMQGGEINIDNAQGCTQFVADKITLNDVRFDRCAANFSVPEPGPSPLLGLALLALLPWVVRRPAPVRLRR